MQYNKKKIGDLVARFRTEKGWSQEHLATYLGVKRRTVYNYETGESDMPATKLLSLCEVFSPEFTYELIGSKALDVEISCMIMKFTFMNKIVIKKIISLLLELTK